MRGARAFRLTSPSCWEVEEPEALTFAGDSATDLARMTAEAIEERLTVALSDVVGSSRHDGLFIGSAVNGIAPWASLSTSKRAPGSVLWVVNVGFADPLSSFLRKWCIGKKDPNAWRTPVLGFPLGALRRVPQVIACDDDSALNRVVDAVRGAEVADLLRSGSGRRELLSLCLAPPYARIGVADYWTTILPCVAVTAGDWSRAEDLLHDVEEMCAAYRAKRGLVLGSSDLWTDTYEPLAARLGGVLRERVVPPEVVEAASRVERQLAL